MNLTPNDPDSYGKFCMAYFYCDFRKRESQDAINLVGSLAAQLCHQFGWFPEELVHAFDHSRNGVGQTKRPRYALLTEVLQSFSSIWRISLLIDALDECGGRKDVLDFLTNLQEATRNVSIFITSRDELDIQEALRSFTRLRIENHLDQVDRDIGYYINHRLQSDKTLQRLTTSIKNDIQRSLTSKSAGM